MYFSDTPIQAWGFTGADPDPEGSILKTVARIQFIGSGRFGELSWLLMVSALIEAFVLMGVWEMAGEGSRKGWKLML